MKTSTKVAGASAGIGTVVALALPLVAAWEGYRNKPYLDLVQKQTWCFGETVDTGTNTGKPKEVYTRAECEAMLQRSLAKYANETLDCLPADAPLSVKAAFTSFSYNVGPKAACGSAAARQARSADYARACVSLNNWVYAGGKRVQGLVNRRRAETELCLRGVTAPGHLSDAEL
jgi:GH24 family phage-related lysozyme (muramidase)